MADEFLRFSSKISKDLKTGCWVWAASKYRGGYGHFRRKIDGKWKMYKAHRYSFEYYKNNNERLGSGVLVCHNCDNPSCVNPEHLFTGTQKDNAQDKVSKGRQHIFRNPKHRWLSKEIAENIRKDYSEGLTYSDLMVKYKTSRAQVSRVVNHQIWK